MLKLILSSLPHRGLWLLALLATLATGLFSLTGLPSASALAAISAPTSAARAALGLRLADDAPARPGDATLPMSSQAQADWQAAWHGTPETRLLASYRLLAEGRLDDALQAAEALDHDHPTFKLAQLLHADLLTARHARLAGFGGTAAGHGPFDEEQRQMLQDEARMRIRALQDRPPAGAIPAEFVQLPASVSHAIAVDTSRSRLYLFENGPAGLRLVEDLYVSIGKQGVDKHVEGDQRTPLGVYFITGQLEGRLLEDRFGSGALPLNYPNAWDRTRGRTGSGILLHGVPAATYSRPPQDSDGCVAMANEDLQRLVARLPQRQTPVIITRRLDWIQPGRLTDRVPAGFLSAVTRWQQARVDGQTQAALAWYSDSGAASDPMTLGSLRQGLAQAPSAIDEISVLTWHDEQDQQVMVVTFRELGAGKPRADRILRQYWGRPAAQKADANPAWRIVAEGQVR
jgi:hypothetical protein